MSWLNNKELRGYIGSWVYIILVFIIIGFLSFQEVPKENKDIITTIIGMLIASLGVVVYTLIGKDENELVKIKEQNSLLLEENNQLRQRLSQMETLLMKLQNEVIMNLSVLNKDKR